MDYDQNQSFAPATQSFAPSAQDAIHAILQASPAAQQALNTPPPLPNQMPQDVPPQQQMRPLDMIKMAAAQGNPQAQGLYKTANMMPGGDDPAIQDHYVQGIIDHPDEIDPSNKFQVMTTMAQIAKQSGLNQISPQNQVPAQALTMPTNEQISVQDLSNVAQGKGSNFLGLQQGAAKDIADLNLRQSQSDKLEAVAFGKITSGGSGGTTMQVFHMLEQQYPNADKMTLLRIAQNKVSQDTTLDPNTGLQTANSGAPNALGELGHGQNFGRASGTNEADLTGKPKIESAITIAHAMAEKFSTQNIADVQAMPLIDQLESLNEKTFDTPYANIAQVPAKFLPKYQDQTTAFDLMQQNRTNLAIPLAKALGVNPTDRDFSATLDSIFDITATKASRRAQIENLRERIANRLANNPISQGSSSAVKIEETKTLNGVNYHKVNGNWMQE